MGYVRPYYKRTGKRVNGYSRNHRKPFHSKYLSTDEQEDLVDEYKDLKVSNVNVGKDKIALKYGTKHLKYPYLVVPKVQAVGTWAHKPGNNLIVVDDGIPAKRRPGVLVHEAVEQHLQKDKDMSYNYAHELALKAEKPFVEKKLKQNWQKYQSSVLNIDTGWK